MTVCPEAPSYRSAIACTWTAPLHRVFAVRARVPVRGGVPVGALDRARQGGAVQPRFVGALGRVAAPEGDGRLHVGDVRDLCAKSPNGPRCVEACPTKALALVDEGMLEALGRTRRIGPSRVDRHRLRGALGADLAVRVDALFDGEGDA